jgi:hypothetical protein
MFNLFLVTVQIFLALIANNPRYHAYQADDDHSASIYEQGQQIAKTCVFTDRCTPGADYVPSFVNEDGTVEVYLNDGTIYSFCLPGGVCED